jgi:hypothetical protein
MPADKLRDRGAAYERFSRAVDGPLTVLALAMIPLIVLPLVMDLSPGAEAAVLAIDYLIWAVFAAEYAIKLVPSVRMYGSTLAASSRTVAGSTPSSSAHRSSGAAIGRPTSRSCRVPPSQGIEHRFEAESGTLL